MNKTEYVTKAFNRLKNEAAKNLPGILTGFGVVGSITAAVLVGKATPKALTLIEEEKKRQNELLLEEAKKKNMSEYAQISNLKPLDVVKVTWKCYLPAVIAEAVSISCIIGANSVNARRNAVLAAAYNMAENALTDFKKAAVETVGTKKIEAIETKVAEEQVKKNPVNNNEVIITGKGEHLCMESLTGRYFKSDIEKIRQAENTINKELIGTNYVSLNEVWYELGLPYTDLGEELGFNVDKEMLSFEFSSVLAEDGTPCLVVGYKYKPIYDYRTFG